MKEQDNNRINAVFEFYIWTTIHRGIEKYNRGEAGCCDKLFHTMAVDITMVLRSISFIEK